MYLFSCISEALFEQVFSDADTDKDADIYTHRWTHTLSSQCYLIQKEQLQNVTLRFAVNDWRCVCVSVWVFFNHRNLTSFSDDKGSLLKVQLWFVKFREVKLNICHISRLCRKVQTQTQTAKLAIMKSKINLQMHTHTHAHIQEYMHTL